MLLIGRQRLKIAFMKETIIKIICFISVFIASAFIISNMMNRGNTDLTFEMADADYPTVTVYKESGDVNVMHGLADKMNVTRFRGDLTPLDSDRSLHIIVNKYGMKITGISYEVRSIDGTRLVENTDIYDYTEKDDTIDAVVNVKDLIDSGKEYMLCIILKNDAGNSIRFYTRIIYDNNFHTEDMIRFVNDFSSKTFSKDQAKSLTTYLESNETGDNTTYADVDIHSNFNQITWGELDPEIEGTAETEILEMDENTGSFRLSYRVKAGPEDSRKEYQVSEYYRIRYSDVRMYLLDYERTMDEIFVPDKTSFANDKIMLGITGYDVNMKENTDGNVVAFVVNGSLYCYRNTDSRLARLFSFDGDQDDERTRFDNHDIRILQVDEGGNVRFLVYGYMNRGRHEGQVGAAVYYYDSSLNTIEEEVYIPYTGSYQMLKSNIELLSYADSMNHFYVYMDGTVYKVGLDDQSSQVVASGIDFDSLVVSASGRMAAWQSGSPSDISGISDNTAATDETTITLEDFGTGVSRQIKADAGNENRPLGFIGEDFVFGESRTTNMIRTATGTTMLPMHTIYIEDKDGEILKEYSSNDIYITGVTIEGNTIDLTRISMSENAAEFTTAPDDQIMSSQMEDTAKNKAVSVSTEDRENIMEIQLTDTVKVSALQLLTPKEVLFEGRRDVALSDSTGDGSDESREQSSTSADSDLYYVYARGYMKGIYREVNEAVNKADDEAGIVVDGTGSYIWRIGSRGTEHSISDIKAVSAGEDGSTLSVCLDAMLSHEGVSKNTQELIGSGETALSILADNLDGKILDLGGCSLEDILYYVGHDYPVLATGDDGSLLIVGYDSKNISVMDPSKGLIYKIGLNDAKALFTSHGNEFVSYVQE